MMHKVVKYSLMIVLFGMVLLCGQDQKVYTQAQEISSNAPLSLHVGDAPFPSKLPLKVGFEANQTTVNFASLDHFQKSNARLITALETKDKPVADFWASSTTVSVGAAVDFNSSDGSTGDITLWLWDFGDGGTSALQNPAHIYTETGSFTVSLTVKGSNGSDTKVEPDFITVVDRPVADFFAGPTTVSVGGTVVFTDASTGDMTSWLWDFGDGQISLMRNPVHIYNEPDVFDVTLTVIGVSGIGKEEKEGFIEVLDGEVLSAAFTGEPLKGNRPFTAHFFDQSGGEVNEWDWGFGDGAKSSEQNPVHTYNTTGEFAVQLTVNGNNKTSTETKNGLVIIGEGNEPTVGFVAEVISVSAAKLNTGSGKVTANAEEAGEFTVKFRDLSSTPGDEIISREWDFGDGAKSSGENPVHTYMGTDADAFTVSLSIETAVAAGSETKPAFVSANSSIIPGQIRGDVTDSTSGIAISGVAVLLKLPLNKIAGVTTGVSGHYFLQAPSGNYTLTAAKSGFDEFTETDVAVSSSKPETIDISMAPTTADDGNGKSFTFNCEHSMKRGHVFDLETLTMDVGDTENCTLKLTNHEPGKTVEVSLLLRKGFRSAIKVEPARSVTDENGEIEITITAIRKGKDWAAWAVPNDKGQFRFNKKTYDTGLAWGMFVEVR
ncbi:MAG: PKD domain-containing protein [Candidatus Anammoxibacter sp.]